MTGVLLLALAIALVTVLFAVQNIAPVTVVLFTWVLEGSLALVVLISLSAGVIISLLASAPAMLRARRQGTRLRRRIAELEAALAAQTRDADELRDRVPFSDEEAPAPVTTTNPTND